jgi:hypothetical protein
MKKTCLTFVLIYLWAAGAVFVAAFLWDPTPPGAQDGQLPVVALRLSASLTIGAVTAIPLTLAITGLLGVATAMKERRMVAAALSGSPPADGARIAAVGTLRAAGSPLEAPLSRRECAIYHYEILFRTRKGSDNIAYWGYGLTPCRIDSINGSIRLQACADLDFPPEEQGSAGLPNAVRHLEATASTASDIDVLTGAGLREFQQLFDDDDGRIAADFRLVVPQASLEGASFQERVVRDGDEVCAFGSYSAASGAFVPSPGGAGIFPVRLLKGTPVEAVRRLRNSAIRSGLAAVPFLALAVGVFFAVWYMSRG